MTGCRPLDYLHAPPRRPAGRLSPATVLELVPGVLSVLMAVASVALTLRGYALAYPDPPQCPVTEIWHGTMYAMMSVATAAAGAVAGLAGVAWVRGGRAASVAGLALNAAFAPLFYALWL